MSRSKRKGDGYERELAKYLDERLYRGRGKITRAIMSGGGRSFAGGGGADLTGTPDIWVEAKRTERFRPYEAMEQAERGIEAKRTEDAPVVINRRNGVKTEDSLVVMRLSDWVEMYFCYLQLIGDWDDKTLGLINHRPHESTPSDSGANSGDD
jgi:hypothetical protein